MSIKRVTIEIDDKVDLNKQTDTPSELKSTETVLLTDKIGTGDSLSTKKSEDIKSGIQLPTIHAVKDVGRTPYDLFVEIKEDNRSMAIFFVIVSFIIYVFKIGTLTMGQFLSYVAITIFVLNVVWFIFPVYSKLKNKD